MFKCSWHLKTQKVVFLHLLYQVTGPNSKFVLNLLSQIEFRQKREKERKELVHALKWSTDLIPSNLIPSTEKLIWCLNFKDKLFFKKHPQIREKKILKCGQHLKASSEWPHSILGTWGELPTSIRIVSERVRCVTLFSAHECADTLRQHTTLNMNWHGCTCVQVILTTLLHLSVFKTLL